MGQAQEPSLRQVKLELAIDAIAKAENVEVSDEEVEGEYNKMAEQYGMKAEDLKKYITAESIKSQLTNSKVVKIVVDSAKATKPEEKDEGAEGEEKPKKRSGKKAAEKAEASEAEAPAEE